MSTAHTPDRPENGRNDDPQDRAPEHGHAPGQGQDERAGYKTDADSPAVDARDTASGAQDPAAANAEAEAPSRVELPEKQGSAGAIPQFDVTLQIRRYNPEVSDEVRWDEYKLTMYGTDRVLDALHKVKWEIDGSLSFRRSCAHGVCGSDAMRINGQNRLACKVLLKDLDLDKPITVEPIKGLPCEKDLIVDMEPFFQSYREIMPFLVAGGNEPTMERYQSPEDRARFDDTTKCILCAACTSSCPVFWTDGQYFGPAAIVNAHRFIFDSRDDAGDLRLEILNDKEGVWRCRTTFNCTEACPRGIQVTKAIAEVKNAILSRSM
ncbi:succinate dehydrogenase iron-sulfur subunit [Kocuria dechangensis]|jgi:succinate dehydrogenase / fumarate reductase iron-sulfur subunit|uniref:succinate dehydrogenase n=1 Tax=Kocuria dechangensis TaxID=1176249 RepID=A0A917LMD8_9MICC|nr:succinate dehydrogenase iron-sulfur subunit [Kocuria dechangensis]GGG42603.1 succinate dehydrogenase iron-sulfur subunit [Kocuria dechangensis]